MFHLKGIIAAATYKKKVATIFIQKRKFSIAKINFFKREAENDWLN